MILGVFGPWQVIAILVVALLLFGGKKIPELMKGLGKGVKEFKDNDSEYGPKILKLCQVLVDYVSAGHFEVYEQLIQEGKSFDDTEGLKKAAELYQVIDSTTEPLLDFNDKYQEIDDLESLVKDLSDMGETLASRFESEDEMINILHTNHKELLDTVVDK